MPAPRSTSPNPERYVIPNLRNACRILKLLGRQRKGLKAADLARELKVPVTTTLRIMSTLCLEGLARKIDGRFELIGLAAGRYRLEVAGAGVFTAEGFLCVMP